uniref:Uncharacterized protein n=1 Tax=Anguilla anguilla TaxID=7936 RepID=A0A0E9ULL5_ANGAN
MQTHTDRQALLTEDASAFKTETARGHYIS